jgi:hypothetical protein
MSVTREDFDRVVFDRAAAARIVAALDARREKNPKFTLKDLRAEVFGQKPEGQHVNAADFTKAATDPEVGRKIMTEVARRQMQTPAFSVKDLREEICGPEAA